jgi:alkanesulfonate monooxygenase SsuD/methylene tetrahydromethanopterin reductase-like flavin-dependent oxidoreductase (luciferase family)
MRKPSAPLSQIGLGLWTMRSMALAPRNRVADYRAFGDDAVLAERLGFHSIWSAEHRIWYDGWCPAPLHALAYVAGRTTTLRLGTAVALPTQHDPGAFADAAGVLHRVSGGRVELGVGLGHRDVEFDALGLRRDRRGRRMDAALDALATRPGPPIWIGGMAPAAIERAATRNLNVLLPQTLAPDAIRRTIATLREHDGWTRRVGTMRDVWIEHDPGAGAALRERYRRFFLEEAGWWVLKGRPAFDAPDLLDAQMARAAGAALIGAPDQVAAGLRELLEAGSEFLMLRINFDMVEHAELQEQVHRIAEELPALLAGVGAAA